MVNACWGLSRGLCRGLLSGLLSTTSGAFEVPAGGWLSDEALALFAAGWVSVSVSLQEQVKSKKGRQRDS